MTDPDVAHRAALDISYHQFFVGDGSWVDMAVDVTAVVNGLVAGKGSWAIVMTGVWGGVVEVTLEPLQTAPAVHVDGWDEVVELSLTSPHGELRVHALMADVPESLPALSAAGPGTYRLRVHAKGRDTDVDGTAFTPCESYLLQAWPADWAEPESLRLTDSYGAVGRSARE